MNESNEVRMHLFYLSFFVCFEDVPLVEFVYLVLTLMPNEGYHRQSRLILQSDEANSKSNEANYVHLCAGVRLKSSGIASVNTVAVPHGSQIRNLCAHSYWRWDVELSVKTSAVSWGGGGGGAVD